MCFVKDSPIARVTRKMTAILSPGPGCGCWHRDTESHVPEALLLAPDLALRVGSIGHLYLDMLLI